MRTIRIPLKSINLQDDGFHLLVEIVVFGETHFAVLDTGASRSVFDKSLIEQHIPQGEIEEINSVEENVATTLFSTSSTAVATLPKLKIGHLKIKKYQAVGLDLASVNEAYAHLGHPLVAGIIGGDILTKYKAKINYKTLVMKLKVKK
jgi:hypothetical protein